MTAKQRRTLTTGAVDTTPHQHPTGDAARFWEEHHRRRRPPAVDRVNPVLAQVAANVIPGAALDLGCGAGGDTLWLARNGWRVTAVDISATATQRVADRAQALGVADLVAAECHDLAHSFPGGRFDLVSAQYLHSPHPIPRARIFRTAAEALLPGGRLLVVDHGSTAPWSWNQYPDIRYPSPQEVAADPHLEPARWAIECVDMTHRRATGPDGQTAVVVDNVLLVRRVEQ